MLTEAVLGPLWAWLFVNEDASFYTLMGGSIIIFADLITLYFSSISWSLWNALDL